MRHVQENETGTQNMRDIYTEHETGTQNIDMYTEQETGTQNMIHVHRT